MKKDIPHLMLHLRLRRRTLDRLLKSFRSKELHTMALITEGHRAEVNSILRWLGDKTTHIKH